MTEDFEFRSLIICDEIREEVGRKQIIIGAYAGVIMMPFMPYLSRIFTIRIEVIVHKKQYEKVRCSVIKPDGSEFYNVEMPFTVNYPEFPVAIFFAQIYLNFNETGDYSVHLSMDGEPVRVGSFKVLTAEELPERD
jgi:hypothetical protein